MIAPLLLQEAAPVVSAPFFDLDPSGTPDVLGAWMISLFTLAVFSFLYRDNPFYKLAEHVFVGLGTAYFTLQYYEEGVLQPIYEWIHAASQTPEGALVNLGGLPIEPATAIALRVGAGLFGLMLLFRMFRPNSWAPRWPLAIMVGVYAALKMTGETQSKFVILLGEQFNKALYDPAALSWSEAERIEQTGLYFTFARVVFITGLICALGHFLFTLRRTKGLQVVSRIGVITLMITFGSMFGFTVLGRIALLIERVFDLDRYTAPAYWLVQPDTPAGGLPLLSPPVVLGALIVGLLALGALQRRRPAAPPPTAARPG
jgi:hypothetical protein